MQLKIVVLSGGSKKWCFDRLERDMMIFCEWLMEGVNTYPCKGTGGHCEYAAFYENGKEIANSTWNGYQGQGDYHYIEFEPFVLKANTTYEYRIVTGSYPQIHHNTTLKVSDGEINCTEFRDANGKIYYDWIPAIKLES